MLLWLTDTVLNPNPSVEPMTQDLSKISCDPKIVGGREYGIWNLELNMQMHIVAVIHVCSRSGLIPKLISSRFAMTNARRCFIYSKLKITPVTIDYHHTHCFRTITTNNYDATPSWHLQSQQTIFTSLQQRHIVGCVLTSQYPFDHCTPSSFIAVV